MEWQVRPISKVCGATGEVFEPGESITCFVFLDINGDLQRLDIKESCLNKLKTQMKILGRWNCIFKKAEDEEKENLKNTINTAEAVFLSLYEETKEESQDKELLKQILALMLERKRILKRIKPFSQSIQTYIHNPSKKTYEVSMQNFDQERFNKLRTQLNDIIL